MTLSQVTDNLEVSVNLRFMSEQWVNVGPEEAF